MKTLVIESFPLLLHALLQYFETSEYISDTYGVDNLAEAFSLLPECEVELIWLDGAIPGLHQEGMIKQIRKAAPHARILLFGTGDSIPEIKTYFKQGIHAYLPKTACLDDISEALCNISAGKIYLPASLNRSFASWITAPILKKKRGQELTQREKEVLSLIVEEHTTGEIAQKLFISYCTVETHRVNLIQKLGVKNTAGMVRVAFETGLYNQGIV